MDQMLLTGLVSFLFNSLADSSAASGSAVVATMEGSRPMLVEVQALVSPTSFGTPRRMSLGIDPNRTNLLLAVLEKRVGFPLQSQDVFVNVAGGGRVSEPAADLGVVDTTWMIVGAGDFNGDGQADVVWQNTVTGDRVVWFMQGTTLIGTADISQLDPTWSFRN